MEELLLLREKDPWCRFDRGDSRLSKESESIFGEMFSISIN
jgi:hypothetical protein